MSPRDFFSILFSPYVIWLPAMFPWSTILIALAVGVAVGWWFL